MTESHDQTLTPTPGQISRGWHSVVDMLPDVARDWQPWLAAEQAYDAEGYIPRELGNLSLVALRLPAAAKGRPH